MTTCKTIQPRLTAYLDGELTGDHGSIVRGHLRECAACRQIARDEAALRDGLRLLPPVDPPASLWAGVQARLAAAEVADARAPSWRRGLARWSRWLPSLTRPQFLAGGLALAAAAVMLIWRPHRVVEEPVHNEIAQAPPAPAEPARPTEHACAPQADQADPAAALPAGDVTTDLVAEPAQTTATYAQAIEELMNLATEARTGWSDEQKTAFDSKIASLCDAIGHAAAGRPRQRAQRAVIRYLQGAVVRDDIVLASGGIR